MIIDLSGHRAIVSGSTAGIGFAIATGLAKAGAAVVINGRQKQTTDKAVQRLSGLAPKRQGRRNRRRSWQQSRHRRLPAPRRRRRHPGQQSRHFRAQAIHRNHRRGLAPLFRRQRDERCAPHPALFPDDAREELGPGRVHLERVGLNIPAEMIHYGVTKTAQLALARGLAELTAGTSVTVNSVLPGPTRSEGVEDFVKAMAKERGVSEFGSRALVLCRGPAELAPQALRLRRRGGQHGGLCLFERGVCHQWRGSPGRWRRRPLDRLDGA